VIWPINPDAAVVVYVSRGHGLAQGVGVALAGQIVMLLLLHNLGHLLRARWAWMDRQCVKVELRWGPRITRNSVAVAAISGLVGVPPSVPTVLLASALGVPGRRFLPVLFAGRLLWFVGLAQLGGWFGKP
jgi:ABC-type Fe3+ transport system permease subunit